MHAHVCVLCVCAHVRVKGQLAGVTSLSQPCGTSPQVIRLGGRHLYLLSCLTSPSVTFQPLTIAVSPWFRNHFGWLLQSKAQSAGLRTWKLCPSPWVQFVPSVWLLLRNFTSSLLILIFNNSFIDYLAILHHELQAPLFPSPSRSTNLPREPP